MNNKIFISIMCIIAFVSIACSNVTAQKQNEDYNLIISSNNATACNLSYIIYPNKTIIYYNLAMEEHNKDFNITIFYGNFSQLGQTCMGVSCTDGLTLQKGSICEDVSWNGTGEEQKDITLIIAEIFLIITVSFIIFILHYNYKKKNYSGSNKEIAESHMGNWSRTFIKTLGNNLMRNSFLWYYSLGWVLLIILKDIVYRFATEEIYSTFVLCLDIYSFGFFLVIIVWIGILINHFMIITDIISDLNLGVDR